MAKIVIEEWGAKEENSSSCHFSPQSQIFIKSKDWFFSLIKIKTMIIHSRIVVIALFFIAFAVKLGKCDVEAAEATEDGRNADVMEKKVWQEKQDLEKLIRDSNNMAKLRFICKLLLPHSPLVFFFFGGG